MAFDFFASTEAEIQNDYIVAEEAKRCKERRAQIVWALKYREYNTTTTMLCSFLAVPHCVLICQGTLYSSSCTNPGKDCVGREYLVGISHQTISLILGTERYLD